MPISLRVVSAEDYSDWVSSQSQPIASTDLKENNSTNKVVSAALTSTEQEGGL